MKPALHPLFTPGFPLYFNIYYENKGSLPVTNVKQIATVGLIWGPSAEQRSNYAVRTFEQEKRELLRAPVSMGDVGVGAIIYTTVHTDHDLTDEEIKAIVEGKKTVYVLAHVGWEERPKGFDLCLYMKRPMSEHITDFFRGVEWVVCEK
jgi:hypothetical protein